MNKKYVIVYKGNVIKPIYELINNEMVHYANQDLGFGTVHESEPLEETIDMWVKLHDIIKYHEPKENYDYAIIEERYYK